MSILRRNRNFFLLWQGQLVSQIGSKIYLIALSWYFVAELKDNQGFVIALLVSSIPFLLFGFGAGPLVEKWNKKWIIFGSDYISSAISFVLAGLIYWEVQNPIYIYIAVFFLNISLVFFNPAVSSIIPSIVKKEDQQEAIALNTTVQFGAQFIGAALGGVLVGYIGVFYAILFDAISFFLSAVTEMFIKYTPQRIDETEESEEESNTKSIYKYILERPIIAKTFFLFSLVNIFLIPMTVYLPILIENYMGLGSKAFGFAESGLPIGAIIASAYFAKKVTTKNVKFILYSVLLISIPFFLIFFGKSIYIIVIGMII
ncbi:MFS transporter, partial [bacterium]|nr:MFS transporter [bacterium]